MTGETPKRAAESGDRKTEDGKTEELMWHAVALTDVAMGYVV